MARGRPKITDLRYSVYDSHFSHIQHKLDACAMLSNTYTRTGDDYELEALSCTGRVTKTSLCTDTQTHDCTSFTIGADDVSYFIWNVENSFQARARSVHDYFNRSCTMQRPNIRPRATYCNAGTLGAKALRDCLIRRIGVRAIRSRPA